MDDLIDPVGNSETIEALKNGPRRIIRRGKDLAMTQAPAAQDDHIGKGAAGIDSGKDGWLGCHE
jgi:hypothetical protein